MKKAINTFIILAGVGLCVYIIVLASAKNNSNGANRNRAPAAAKNGESAAKTARVKMAVVRPQPITEAMLLPGTVEAWEDIDLSAKVGGIVEWIGPKEGTRVTSGEAVVRLDSASKQALLNQAKAQQAQAEKQYARVAKLVRDQVLTPAELDNVTAQRDVAKATVDVAQVALNDATLYSPIDGVIDRVAVDEGEHVNGGQLVAKIVQIDPVKILVNVPEKDVCYCSRGQLAVVLSNEVSWDQIPWDQLGQIPWEKVFQTPRDKLAKLPWEGLSQIAPDILSKIAPGQIYYVALTGDGASRTYRMEIKCDNPDRRLRPGMIVRVGLIRRRIEKALVVPLYAVVDRGDRKVVFVEKDGRAVQIDVALGIIEGNRVQVGGPLAEGDRLIVVGHRDLADGTPVQVEGTEPL